MDLLPLASILSSRAMRRQFASERTTTEPTASAAHDPGQPRVRFRGRAAVRARVAGWLYRLATVVQPRGHRPAGTR